MKLTASSINQLVTAQIAAFWLVSAVTALALTDYERELQSIETELACLKAGATTALTKSPVDLRCADLLFQRAAITQALPDLREAAAALKRLSRVTGPPGVALARVRLALDFHCVSEAKSALESAEPSGDPRLALLAFDLAMQDGKYAEVRRLAQRWEAGNARAEELARSAELAAFFGDYARSDRLLARAEEQLTVKEMRFFAWLAMQRGMLKFHDGDLAGARLQYARADKAYSGWWKVQQRQAELCAAEGRFPEAEALYRQLIISCRKPEIEQELGELLGFQGRHAEAKACYRRAADIYLESAQRGEILYLHHLVTLHAEGLDDTAEAIRWARIDLAARDSVSARDALAWVNYLAGNFSAAAAEIERALSTGTRDPHVLYHAGRIMAAAGRRSEAGVFFAKEPVRRLMRDSTFHTHRYLWQ